MFDPAFLIGIKQYKFLLVYLLCLVPIVNIFAIVGIKIYLGLNGRSMAAKSPMFANQDELNGYMKGVDHAGKILFFVAIIAMAIGFTVAFSVMGALFAKHGPEAFEAMDVKVEMME